MISALNKAILKGDKMEKLAFVLGAGGARGIAHIGFLQAMDEFGIKPDLIAGCSMGSIVGACYAKGYTPEELKNIALKLRPVDIIDPSIVPFQKKAFLSSRKMQGLLEGLFGTVTFDELKIPFSCIATDLKSGETKTFSSGYVEEAVRASASIPGVFKPVEKDGFELVDGGVLKYVPVKTARDMGATKIIAVDVLGEVSTVEDTGTLIGKLFRVVDIATANMTKNYLEVNAPDILLRPELGDMSQYKVERLDFAYQKGYEIGIKNMDRIKELIAK